MFIIELTYVSELKQVDAHMTEHVTFLDKYYASGHFLVSGRKIPREGGIIVALGNDLAEVEAIMREDPFHRHGLAQFRIIQFRASQRADDMPERITKMSSNLTDFSRARAMWRYVGEGRPPFAIAPAPDQESVWDYPRPPRVEFDPREVIVLAADVEVARTQRAVRILETASPPTFYIPEEDVNMALLEPADSSSICEWKGAAHYFNVRAQGQILQQAAWSYADPHPEYAGIRRAIAFYPSRLACYVAGVRVQPQPGHFYGGWITPELVGPFKGEPGSSNW